MLPVTSAHIRQLITARRARNHHFDRELFADPAWDILLEAFIAFNDRQHPSVSALCDCSGVPSSTALRWIAKLEQDGWLVQNENAPDENLLALSPRGVHAMLGWLEHVAPIVVPTS